jgi:hypothetical protein
MHRCCQVKIEPPEKLPLGCNFHLGCATTECSDWVGYPDCGEPATKQIGQVWVCDSHYRHFENFSTEIKAPARMIYGEKSVL